MKSIKNATIHRGKLNYCWRVGVTVNRLSMIYVTENASEDFFLVTKLWPPWGSHFPSNTYQNGDSFSQVKWNYMLNYMLYQFIMVCTSGGANKPLLTYWSWIKFSKSCQLNRKFAFEILSSENELNTKILAGKWACGCLDIAGLLHYFNFNQLIMIPCKMRTQH